MKVKSNLYVYIVFLLFIVGKITAQNPISKKHKFYISSTADYYLDRYNITKFGVATASFKNTLGFKIGVNYNFKLFKKVEGYFTSDAFYGKKYSNSEIYYNFREYLNQPSAPDNFGLVKHKFQKDYLHFLVGYEHRFSIPKSNIKIFAAFKAGVLVSFKDYIHVFSSYVEPFDSSQTYPIGLYTRVLRGYSKGLNAITGQFSVGVQLPVFKTLDCKLALSYTHPFATNEDGESFYFYRLNGEQMGTANYLNKMNHLSLGLSIGF